MDIEIIRFSRSLDGGFGLWVLGLLAQSPWYQDAAGESFFCPVQVPRRDIHRLIVLLYAQG